MTVFSSKIKQANIVIFSSRLKYEQYEQAYIRTIKRLELTAYLYYDSDFLGLLPENYITVKKNS